MASKFNLKARWLVTAAALAIAVACGILPWHRGSSRPEKLPAPSKERAKALSRAGETRRAAQEAERYLETAGRDDELAFEIMRAYAAMKDARFAEFAISYATGDARLLMQGCDIAANENWREGVLPLAKALAQERNIGWGYCHRAVEALVSFGDDEAALDAIPRLESLAAKRYQREDTALLKCRISPEENIETLRELATNALMDEVREAAQTLLKGIEQ